MNKCPNCGTNAGVQHDTIIMGGKTVHILSCPHCGNQAGAATIAEAVKKWNEAKEK